MLRVGLTGGIGSGKSTAAAVLRSLGAVVVDADAVAREVVAPGTPGLREVVERFGEGVLGPGGDLDRAALGRIVFADPAALRDLEAITHPAIEARTAELVAAAPQDAVLVHDMPLIVEKGSAGEYHLVLVVGAAEETRVGRLVDRRGMSEEDARARVRAQAGDDARRAAADVWLENEGSAAALEAAVRRVWHGRVEPFATNLRAGVCAHQAAPVLSPPDPGWPSAAARLLARLRHALGEAVVTLDHVGPTAVPGLPAPDVLDLQVGLAGPDAPDAPAVVAALAAAGFPRLAEAGSGRHAGGAGPGERLHCSCDPGRVARVHVREAGSADWELALLVRDWLRAVPTEQDGYAATATDLAARLPGGEAYTAGLDAWLADAGPRARAWAADTGWRAGRRPDRD